MRVFTAYFILFGFLIASLYFGVQGMLLMRFNEEIEAVNSALPAQQMGKTDTPEQQTEKQDPAQPVLPADSTRRMEEASQAEQESSVIEAVEEEFFTIYDGFIFYTEDEFRLFLQGKDIESYIHCRPMTELPAYYLLVITSISFSCMGTSILIIRRELRKKSIALKQTILNLVLGAMTGLIILGLAELVPTLLVETEGEIRPITLVFLSFFGGMYVERFFQWIDGRFGSIFKTDDHA